MFNKKLKVNFQSFINVFSIVAVLLLIVSFIFKIKTLAVVGELLVFFAIIGSIFGIVFSIASKFDKK